MCYLLSTFQGTDMIWMQGERVSYNIHYAVDCNEILIRALDQVDTGQRNVNV